MGSSALTETQDFHFRVMLLPATTGQAGKMESGISGIWVVYL